MTDELDQRLKAVERLTALYRPERIVHLIATTVSLFVLLGSAGGMIYKGQAGPAELTLMFGSSGLIAYSASRLLTMWNQALRLLASQELEKTP